MRGLFSYGCGGLVLPKFNNTTFVKISESSTFGIEDITGSLLELYEDPNQYKSNFEIWYEHQSKLKRVFTVQCQSEDCIIYTLAIEDLYRMKNEF